MLYKYLILFIFLIGSSAPSTASAKIVDRIIAIVNDEIITLTDLKDFIKKMGREASHKEQLNTLIDETLTKQLIQKLDLSPESEEIETQISGILKAQGIGKKELIQFLEQRGMTYKEYKENIKRSMENERLLDREIKSSIAISEQEIRGYYYSHIKKAGGKKSYHVRQLFLPATNSVLRDQQLKIAKRAYKESKKGVSFSKIVKKYSKDPQQTESGGDLGFVSQEDLISPLRKVLKRLKINQTGKPVVTKAGVHLLHLVKVKKEKGQSYQEAKAGIQRTLYEKRFKRILARWIKAKREEAYIKILPVRKLASFVPPKAQKDDQKE